MILVQTIIAPIMRAIQRELGSLLTSNVVFLWQSPLDPLGIWHMSINTIGNYRSRQVPAKMEAGKHTRTHILMLRTYVTCPSRVPCVTDTGISVVFVHTATAETRIRPTLIYSYKTRMDNQISQIISIIAFTTLYRHYIYDIPALYSIFFPCDTYSL